MRQLRHGNTKTCSRNLRLRNRRFLQIYIHTQKLKFVLVGSNNARVSNLIYKQPTFRVIHESSLPPVFDRRALYSATALGLLVGDSCSVHGLVLHS
jgi:hypothetical protein